MSKPKLSTFESKPLTKLFIEILKGNNYAQLLSKITGNQPSPIVIQLKRIEKEGYLISYQEDLNILNKNLYKPNWKKVITSYFNSEVLLPPNTKKEDIEPFTELFNNEQLIKELFTEDILNIFTEGFSFFDIISLLITALIRKYDKNLDPITKEIFFSTGNAIANKNLKAVSDYEEAINKKINFNKDLNNYLQNRATELSKVILRTIKDYRKNMYFK